MDFIGQWLVRITISGILTGLFVIIFWLVQKHQPDLLSGRQKKLIWLILLFSACLVIPWPAVIYLPESILHPIQTLRLPDLEQTRIPSDQVNTSAENMNDYISAITQAENDESVPSYTFQLPTDEIPRFIYRPGLDFFAKLMSYWRIIYWIGLILTLIGLFLGKLRVEYLRIWGGRYQRQKNKLIVMHAEQKYQGGFPDQESAQIWASVLSLWRDALGYYRRGQVKYQIDNPDAPAQIIKNWLGHQLPVPREISEMDYPQYWYDKSAVRAPLALALYRLHHPDVITSLLYCLVRIIYWFIPVWMWLHPLFLRNLSEQRSQVLAQRLAKRENPARSISIKGKKPASLVIVLCGVLLISFLLINLPIQLLPFVERIEDQTVDRYGWQMQELSFSGFTGSTGSGDPLPALNGEMSVFLFEIVEYGAPDIYLAKTRINKDGPSVDWLFHVRSALGGRSFSPGQLKLMDYRVIGSRSLLLLLQITDMTDLPETGEAILLHLDLVTGSLAGVRILENPLQQPRAYSILHNGDLLVIEWLRTADLIDNRFFSSLARPQEYRAIISRTNKNGQLIWQIDPLDQGVNIARNTWSGFSRNQGIDVISPDEDGGFYLAMHDNWIIHERSSDSDDLIYRNPGSLLRFDDQGQLLWHNQLGDQRYPFVPDQILISEQGQLFLSGTQIYQKAYFSLPSWSDAMQNDNAGDSASFSNKLDQSALHFRETHVSGHILSYSAAGELLWQKNLAGALSSQIFDTLLVDEQLTISLNNWLPAAEQPGMSVQQSLIRLDYDGQVDAWFDLPRIPADQTKDPPSVWLTQDQLFLSPEIIKQIQEEQTVEQLPEQETYFEIR